MTDPVPAGGAWTVQLALESVDGSEPDLRGLLEIWLRLSPRLLCDIRSALENDDAENLLLAAHTLKGSLLILCAEEACLYAAKLEAAGQKRQLSSAAGLLTKLEAEIAVISRLVTAYMNTP